MIIDCHGHYTTEPKPLMEFRQKQIAAFKDKGPLPSFGSVKIGDDELPFKVMTDFFSPWDGWSLI